MGGTAADILALADGTYASALVVCADDDGQAVSCASPHRIEPVGDWGPDNGAATDEACRRDVARYTQRQGLPSDPLTALTQRGARDDGLSVSRCVVSSAFTLTGTVYRLAGAQPPQAIR
ncbi:MAG: hypothetical protein Q4G51_05860 [Dermatophilus congolensis]|nr:hypothetical protein [Dermatophilus congolensis]